MASFLLSFFKMQLGTEDKTAVPLDLPSLYAFENSDLISLQEPFSEDEVRSAVFSCAPEKALGPDGFPLLFYQRFWRVIKADLMEVFHHMHRGSLNLDMINRGWICLIPKKIGADEVRDFRPISLGNGMIKIISKVLATRLQCLLEGLINPFQMLLSRGGRS